MQNSTYIVDRYITASVKPLTNEVVLEQVMNDYFTPSGFLSRLINPTQIDPRRDINEECGYLDTMELTPSVYRDMYDRESVATRVVQCLPLECWQAQPSIFEDDDTDNITPFEAAWEALPSTLNGNSWHKDKDQGNMIWQVLKKADILSGIGHFGVMLLGIDDGAQLSDPIEGFENGFPDIKPANQQATGEAHFGSTGAGTGVGTDLQYGKMTSFGGDQMSYLGNERHIIVANRKDCSYDEAAKAVRKLRARGIRATMHCTNEQAVKGSIIVNEAQDLDARGRPITKQATVNSAAPIWLDRKDTWAVVMHLPTTNIAPPAEDDEENNYNYDDNTQKNDQEDIPDAGASTEQDGAEDPSAGAEADTDQTAGDETEGTGAPNADDSTSMGTSRDGSMGPAGSGLDMDEPEVPIVETKRHLLYLRVYDESLVQITRYEADPSNPRFGQPVMYLITINDPREMHSGIGLTTATLSVHWSRVIHIAETGSLSSEVFGTPRQRPVWNRLCDLKKIYGACGEGYWRGAFFGLAFSSHPQMGGDVAFDITSLRAQVERFMNSSQRYLAVEGGDTTPIAPAVADPTAQIEVELEAICIVLGIPMRIFCGSERGDLASSQDDGTWNGRLKDRQSNHITPRIISPFVDRLIMAEVLPQPQQYRCEWPDLDALQPQEIAANAAQIMTALSTYMQGGVDSLMSPKDVLVRLLKYDEKEADAILEAVKQHMQEANPNALQDVVPGHAPVNPMMDNDGSPMSDEDAWDAQYAQPDQHQHIQGDVNQGEHFHEAQDPSAGGGGFPPGKGGPPANGKSGGSFPPGKSNRPPQAGQFPAKKKKPGGFMSRFGGGK